MGEMSGALRFCALLAVLCTCWPPRSSAQELQEQDALCTEGGCHAVYFQRKTFRESARFCKDKAGHLATLRSSEEVAVVHELLSFVEQRGPRARVRLWMGLHRQPRQCSATRPLRGFQWITGEQDTAYTNWARADSTSTCAVPRCVVVTVNTAAGTRDQADNFKWLDGSCTLPVDGFMCYFPYRGMCPSLKSEGGGHVLYTTPFGLISAVLTPVPFGSVANVPCPDGDERAEDQSVLCLQREDGSIGWSKDAPLCSDGDRDRCKEENGGCEHFCQNAGTLYYCECSEGFVLAEDRRTCQPDRSCGTANCEFDCVVTARGFRCKCPNGYLLAPDGHSCLDVDECLQAPCPHICVNVPGTFECRCDEGYEPDEDGECVDVDECKESSSCEHRCENTVGSFSCHCPRGLARQPGGPDLCQDVDECQFSTGCDQLCINYLGGFECNCKAGFELQSDQHSCIAISEGDDEYSAATSSYQTSIPWAPEFPDFVPGITSLEWLQEQTITQLPTDLGWFTEAPQEDTIFTAIPRRPSEDHNLPGDVLTQTKPAQNTVKPSASPFEEDDNPGDPVVVLRVSAGPRPAVKNDKGAGRVVEPPKIDPAFKATPTRFSVPPQAQTTEFASDDDPSESKGKNKHVRSWLLVALLVPLCVFIVVMLALGIVYCTSCAVEQNKSITDCYRWIITSKSEDKNKAQSRA